MILIAWQFSLFLFDFIHAVGGVLNVRWADDGRVAMGPYCVTQGIIKQIGTLGAALTTLVSPSPRCHHGPHVSEKYRHTSCQILAVHTFIAALWRTGIEARGFAFGLVGLTCVFIALWVGIGNRVHKKYEAPSPVGYFNHYPFVPFPYLWSCLIVLVLDQSSIQR
jgi:hypothetical protein